jgi:mono/diheme cytochrome c family protein
MRDFKNFIFAGLAVAALSVQAAPAGAQTSGQQGFDQTCAACHQPDGKGIPDAFPALAGSAVAQGDPDTVLATVLDGRNAMPSFRSELNDEQLAAILTYVRSAWGNSASAVTPAQAAAARSKGAPAH